MVAKTPMMAMTTRSSMSVNAFFEFANLNILILHFRTQTKKPRKGLFSN
jgi:hypothetical protein